MVGGLEEASFETFGYPVYQAASAPNSPVYPFIRPESAHVEEEFGAGKYLYRQRHGGGHIAACMNDINPMAERDAGANRNPTRNIISGRQNTGISVIPQRVPNYSGLPDAGLHGLAKLFLLPVFYFFEGNKVNFDIFRQLLQVSQDLGLPKRLQHSVI